MECSPSTSMRRIRPRSCSLDSVDSRGSSGSAVDVPWKRQNVSPGLRDSITYFTDPALSGAYAHIPLLVTFCESMLDPSVKRCMFCGYSSRNRVHAEDLQARASELMADLREIFANASPREVSDWGPVSAGSSSALMEEDELRVVEEIEERNIGVAGLLLNTKELKLFCCDKCKNSADEADTKAVQRLRQSLLSQRENFLPLSQNAKIFLPAVRPVLAILIAEVLAKEQKGVIISQAMKVVTFALQELRSGQRRIWRSYGGDLPYRFRSRLRRFLPETTLATPAGLPWPSTFVALLFPPTKDEAHVFRCQLLLEKERNRSEEQADRKVAQRFAFACRTSVPKPNSVQSRSVEAAQLERMRMLQRRSSGGEEDVFREDEDDLEATGDWDDKDPDAAFSSLAPCAEYCEEYALQFFENMAEACHVLPQMPVSPEDPEILRQHKCLSEVPQDSRRVQWLCAVAEWTYQSEEKLREKKARLEARWRGEALERESLSAWIRKNKEDEECLLSVPRH